MSGLRWTPEQFADFERKRGAQEPMPKPPKYAAVKVTDPETGDKVASKRELKRLQALRQLFRAGEIDLLATQAWIRIEGGRYEADAVYGKLVLIDGVPHLRLTIEDAKGFVNPLYARKRAQIRERYGIEIKET